MIKTDFISLYEELNQLNEGVSQDNPYLKTGIKKWLGEDPNAKGLVVSANYRKDNGLRSDEIEINQTYHTDKELHDILNNKAQELGLKNEYDFTDVSALHDKGLLQYYDAYKEVVKELNSLDDTKNKPEEPTAEVPAKQKAAQLSKKIIKAFKDAGLATDELIVKNGVGKTKASAKLKKLKQSLFGESLEENFEEEIEIDL